MSSEERMARAQDYVFGLMDESERRRAERDLEIDPDFRDCVLSLAERLRMANRDKAALSEDAWADVSRLLAGLPQMAGSLAGHRPPGRAAATPGKGRAVPIAIGLAVAFALGCLAGRLLPF